MNRYIRYTLLVLVLLLFASTAAALPTVAHDTVQGEMYVASTANWESRSSTNNFDVPNGTVVFARYYVGVWTASTAYDLDTIHTTFNGHALPTNPSYYTSDMGVTWVPFNVTDYVNPGEVNTATVDSSKWGDGRQYGSTLVVVLKNESKPLVEYWVAEGLDWMHAGNDDSTTFFNGTIDLAEIENAGLYSIHLTGYNYEDLNGKSLPGATESVRGAYFDYLHWDDIQGLLVAENQTVNVGRGNDDYTSLVFHALSIEYKAPDLVPTGLSPFLVSPNTVNTMTATIENRGSKDSTAFNVSLLVDGVAVDMQEVSGLAIGSNTTVDFHWTPDGSKDAYTLTVVADPENKVIESDDGNNVLKVLVGTDPAVFSPAADFSADKTSGVAPLTVTFTDQSAKSPTSWLWDFGDGNTSTEQHPVHTYTIPGTYTVSLTATNSYGSNTCMKTDYLYAGRNEYSQNISFTAGDTAVYQQDVVVHRSAGDAYEEDAGGLKVWHIFVGDLCREDYGDVRFADAAGTPLAYYLWPDYTSEQAWFHVRLEGADQPGMLMIWYGDQAVTTTSDGSATYLLFDQFDDTKVDSTKWEAVQNNGISVNSGKLHVSSGPRDFAEIFSRTPIPSGIIVQFRIQSNTYATSLGFGNRDHTGNGSSIGLQSYSRNYQSAIYSGEALGTRWSPPRTWSSGSTGGDVILDAPSGYYTEEFVIAPDEYLKERRDGGAWTISSRYTGVSGPKHLQLVHYRGYGSMDLDYILVRAYSASPPSATSFKPVGDFTANVTGGNAPLAVQFNDTSLNSPTSWSWDFGDNTTSTEQHPVHTYETEGTYTVNLTVTNADGNDSEVKTDYITVGSGVPVGNFTANVTSGNAPLAVQFNDNSTVNPAAWSWDFGDGATSTEQHPVHTYETEGTYTVNLTVTNTYGSNTCVKTDYLYAGRNEYSQNISFAAGDTAVYQQDVVVHRSAGDAYEETGNGTNIWHLCVVDQCREDYGDVRFKDAAGKELTYYLWPDFDNNSARFSVRLEGADQPGALTVCYGNPAIETTSGLREVIANPSFETSESWTYSELDSPGGCSGTLLSPGWSSDGTNSAYIYVGFASCFSSSYWGQFAQSVTLPPGQYALVFDCNGSRITAGYGYMSVIVDGVEKYRKTSEGVQYAQQSEPFTSSGDPISIALRNGVSSGSVVRFGSGCWDNLIIRAYSASPPSATSFKPVGNFTANVTGGNAPLAVQFTDTSRNSPTSWSWDFGDGATSTEQHPAHTYETEGTYTVNLTVTNKVGSNSTVKTDYITVTTPTLPDLAVSTLSLNSPKIGEVFSAAENTYLATITNIGTADAGAFVVGFNVSGATGTVAVDGLAAGANVTVTWTDETVRDAGDPVTVTVTADPEDSVTEMNEENNIKTVEKTVVPNGYRGKRWTGGEDLETAKTYTVRGDLVCSSGTSTYLSASTGWTDYTVTWTAGDLAVPEGAAITAARLYVPYTWDKGPVFPANVTLTFNGETVDQTAFYADEKLWGSSYPYGMTVYDVTAQFSTSGNTAVLANAYPGGGNVSIRGMLLAVVYDDGVTAPHTILMNEGFDLLYGGEAQSTTPEQATAYAPFALENPSDAVGARLVTVAPGAGPTEGDLLFNDKEWTRVWNYTGTTQIGVDDRDVTAFLAGENLAGFRSDADYMEAAAAFLVVEHAPEPGSIAVTSTPTGAAVFLDGTETGEVTNCLLTNVPAGDHVVTLTLEGYADASALVTVVSGETAEVILELTTATGSLAVTSTPEGAAILIDGAETGDVTNTTLDVIAVGLHTVTLRKDGYVDTTAEIEINYNETATLHLDLVEAIGSLAVTSAPTGAAIFLDGVDTGDVTNATLTGVPAGEHTVTVTKPGYADASATVTVEHDKTVPVHFGLVPPTGSILVTSTPDGARIFLDDLETGEMTNATLVNVPVGKHTVRVEHDGYREAEAAVTVTAGGTAPCHLDLEKIVVLPVADFSATPTSGAAPLVVRFTDASTSNPTSWAWDFGDGGTSTEQNPIYTYLTTGTYTVSLRVTNEDGSNSTANPDYIAVTVLQGGQTQVASLDIPGCTVTTGSDGKAQVGINTSKTGAQVTGNRVTIPQENYTLIIEMEGDLSDEDDTITGTVASIRLDTQPVITEFDAIGTVSASVSANLTGIREGAGLTTTVSRDVAPDARSAFQLAASDNGLNLGDVAYTLKIVRTNLENTRDIAGATIRMTVSPAWVEAHGGDADMIRIIRFAGDTQEVLPTRFVGTDASGNLIFEADSPNGFSVFGLAAVSAVPQPSSPRSSGGDGGGSQASVGAAGNLKAGDRVVLAMDRTAVSAVTFTAKNPINDVMVTMAKGSLPRDAKAPTGTVYQYIEATLYKAAAEDFSSVQFRFAVPNAWLAAQGCTAEEIGLFRLTDDGWREVPVEVLGEENGNAIFAASPEGFSLFAITATGQAPDIEEPTLEPIETETTPPADVTTSPVDTIPTTPQPTPLPVGIAALALGVSLLLVRRRT